MEENSALNRVCSQKWICWLGRRSYSLYIIHLIYARWFWGYVCPQLSKHIPYRVAVLVSCAIAFSLTLLLAMLSYRFIEMPAQRLKQRLNYGAVKEDRSSQRLAEEALVKIGA
jgi:peptidoglycan/LPS O-acetylase OafA/YrhL